MFLCERVYMIEYMFMCMVCILLSNHHSLSIQNNILYHSKLINTILLCLVQYIILHLFEVSLKSPVI